MKAGISLGLALLCLKEHRNSRLYSARKSGLMLMLLIASCIMAVFGQSGEKTADRYRMIESDVKNFYVAGTQQLQPDQEFLFNFANVNLFVIPGTVRSLKINDERYLCDVLDDDGNKQIANCYFIPGLMKQIDTGLYRGLFQDAYQKIIWDKFPGDGKYEIFYLCELRGIYILGFRRIKETQ